MDGAGCCERFARDVEDYLNSLLPDDVVPSYQQSQIATYCGMRFAIYLNDTIAERDEEWRRIIKRNECQVRRMSYIERKNGIRPKKESEDTNV